MPPATLHPYPWIDLLIILALVALNGLFAMSELSIVSSRTARLETLAKAGRRGAVTAMALRQDPGKFLSTVQIGITLIGIVAGAFSGERLGGPTAERLQLLGFSPDRAASIGFTLVIGITTYVSLIAGELVPKQIALRNPEPIAVIAAGPMRLLSRVTAPIVWLLDGTSLLVFRLLGLRREASTKVTAEELHLIAAEATRSGVIEESERAIISGVVRLADRPVREVMTPRNQVDWLDVSADSAEIRRTIEETRHTRLPVAEGSVERIVGVVQVRDLALALFDGRPLDLRALMREAPVVPDRMDAMDALGVLREAEVPVALVHDEYGHFDGLVTPTNLLAAIAGGEFASDHDGKGEPGIIERDDGSYLVSGALAADAMADRLGLELPEGRDYATAAGFALALFKRLPEEGEHVRFGDWRIEVVDMDGRRVDKLLASCIVDRDDE